MMTDLLLKILVCMLVTAPAALASESVDRALTASTAKRSDALSTKVALLLHLLNDENYLYESSPDPARQYTAEFKSTPREKAIKLLDGYSKNSSGAKFAPYDLDSARTADEMLAQRIGGSCGTQARVFAELLRGLGVDDNDMRIVSAVVVDDYAALCPGGRGAKINSKYRGGASGHVLVLLKAHEKWVLINTTAAPYDYVSGPHAAEVKAVRDRLHEPFTKKSDYEAVEAKARAVVRRLQLSDLDIVDYLPPQELERKLNSSAVVLPTFHSLPPQLKKLLVYDVVAPSKYSNHKWSDRYDIIASGAASGDICRFTTPDKQPD
jgi:hypothetical protein